VRAAGAAVRPSSNITPKRRRIDDKRAPVFQRLSRDGPVFYSRWVNVHAAWLNLQISSPNASIIRPTTRTSRCFATATDAHPHAAGNSDQSLIGPDVPSGSGPRHVAPLNWNQWS
jgi:hypothetical protein